VEHRRDVALRRERHEDDGGEVGKLWIRSHASRRFEAKQAKEQCAGWPLRSSGTGAWPSNVVCAGVYI
jgi:hypothetical protein